MRSSTRYRSKIARFKRLAPYGGNEAVRINNIAATYRMAGNRRRAFEWWQRAAARRVYFSAAVRLLSGLPRIARDGSALLELGYCYQYGIGVRQDDLAARRAYRAAARSRWICEYSREEALYHLAVAILDLRDGQRDRRRAAELLRQAAADGDYPQASKLLKCLERGEMLSPCRCRRGLRPSLGRQAQCALHGKARRGCRSHGI